MLALRLGVGRRGATARSRRTSPASGFGFLASACRVSGRDGDSPEEPPRLDQKTPEPTLVETAKGGCEAVGGEKTGGFCTMVSLRRLFVLSKSRGIPGADLLSVRACAVHSGSQEEDSWILSEVGACALELLG